MVFSIRLSEEERSLASAYAGLHAMSLGDAFKKALFDKIEDEYDIAIGAEALEEYKKDPVSYSHEEVWEQLLK